MILSNEEKLKIHHLFQEIKSLQCIDNFVKPFPDLFEKIKKPMDLSTLEDNFNNNKYKSLKLFREDLSLIWKNANKLKSKDDTFIKNVKQLQYFCNGFFRRKNNYSQNTKYNLGKKRKRNENVKTDKQTRTRNKQEISRKGKTTTQNNNKGKFDKKSLIQTRSQSKNKRKTEEKKSVKDVNTRKKETFPIKSQTVREIEKEKSDANKVIFKITKFVDNNTDDKSDLVIEIDDEKSVEEPLVEEEQKQMVNENEVFIKQETNYVENEENDEDNNEDFHVEFSELEKLQLLILISKLSVPNQVKLLYKIEDKHKKIITIFSGNLNISFKNMPKNHYLEVMQYGKELLSDQNELLNNEK